MSAFPDSEIRVPIARSVGLSPVQFAALAASLAVLGLSSIWPAVLDLWAMWTTDPLKSIGMVIPVVSLVLILRAWRGIGWRAEGTWWGLVLLVVTAVLARVQQRAVLLLVISPHWSTGLPPVSLVLLAYGSGVVLLFGGTRLYRAALFPIVLLWFANPIPHAFNLLVDLPLQRVSAHIARAFAMDLGQTLTPDHLRLMFTPSFGMFIAPGCNGIRGAVTMGFIALIAGYVYRFRWYANAAVVAGAILLGYVFNLLRLCLLVVYYVIALHFTSLQDKGEMADYIIGATLFLIATLLLFAVIHHLRDAKAREVVEADATPRGEGPADHVPRWRYARVAAMGVIVLFGGLSLAQAVATYRPSAIAMANAAERPFPQRLGSYNLVRTWNETVVGGPIVYAWGEYAPPGGGGTPIAVGVSPVLGWHDPLICHSIRGEHPLWEGPLTITTADLAAINFSSALYNDGVTQYLDASTQCSEGVCGEFATERTHFGLVYSRLAPKSLLNQDPKRPIPLLFRVETSDVLQPADAARQQMTQDLRAFLASVKLDDLTRPYNY